MIYNETTARQIAENLLQINAIKLNPQTPFTWASGLKSPIYCDNRLTLSYPLVRNFIKQAFAACIKKEFSDVACIAGVATAGIAHGALIADELQLPFCYVRNAPKQHGLSNQIEGRIEKGSKVVVVEDLISTGKSSLEVVQALRSADVEVIGMVAIFTYGFAKADEAFANANCKLVTLSDYEHLIPLAVEKNYVSKDDRNTLLEWRKSVI